MPITKMVRTFGLAFLTVLAMLLLRNMIAHAQASDEEKLLLGASLYAENCAVCHGENGEGRIGATLAKDWPSIRPDLTVKTIIEDGVPGSPMRPWLNSKGGPFTPEQVDALVTYILSWQTGGLPAGLVLPSPTPRPPIKVVPNVEGDPNLGAVLYDQNCAMCHGSNGEGRIGATLAKDWPSIRPDLNVKAIVSSGIAGAMPAWAQAKGGPLSEQDINNLVAFVLSLNPDSVEQVEPGGAPAQPSSPSFWSSWGGAILALVLFVGIIVIIVLLQRRPPKTG